MFSQREERAKEALVCLRISGHEPMKGHLLDLGCGLGFTTDYFFRKGISTVGLDFDKKALHSAKVASSGTDLVLASGVKLPFVESVFHTVILNDVLEHVSYGDAEFILKQIRKVLGSDGRLYISVANKYQIREPHTNLLFITWLPRRVYDAVFRTLYSYTVYPYTVQRLKSLCKETGFTCENYTWLYARRKILNPNYIYDRATRVLVNIFKTTKLPNSLLLRAAEQFSIILFICR
jgi:cyclopropane fatty-acyl-phospholipid synthase-like methyltransferase